MRQNQLTAPGGSGAPTRRDLDEMLNAQRQRLALSEADTALERNKANQLKDTLAREQALTRATEKRGEVIRQVSQEARR